MKDFKELVTQGSSTRLAPSVATGYESFTDGQLEALQRNHGYEMMLIAEEIARRVEKKSDA